MNTVYKYPFTLTRDGRVTIEVPTDSVLLCVRAQHNKPVLYAAVNKDCKTTREVRLRVVDTGEEFDQPISHQTDFLDMGPFWTSGLRYLGTFELEVPNSNYVGHAFEEIK